MFFVILILSFGNQILAKSIQNTSLTEETLQNRMEKLETSMTALETTMIKTNVTLSKLAVKEHPVLFFAIIDSNSFNIQLHSTVVFETVVINEGDHYNKYDGVFVAPQDGIYLFSWTVSTYQANYIMTELVVEKSIISSTGERDVDSGTHSSASMTAFCRMKKDDHAFIRTASYGSTHYIYSNVNHPRTSFLGVLLYPDL